jgi:hypothetical protein
VKGSHEELAYVFHRHEIEHLAPRRETRMGIELINPETIRAHAQGPVPLRSFWEARIVPFLEKYFWVVCLCFVGIASARIISTYSALSLTTDEPTHFACGLEYVAKHVYRIEPQHPPLARMMEALGPYLAGARPLGLPLSNSEGLSVIARSGHVDRTIFLMRLGNLPFFLLACLVVCGWSWHAFGKPVAVVATGLFTLLPAVLADAGLAITDTALGATVGGAFFAALLWAERSTWLRTLLLGLFTALACLSKFTALGYLPGAGCLALACYLAVRWPGWRGLWTLTKQRAATFALAAATTALLIWAGYWFSVAGFQSDWFGKVITLPAPEFLEGIREALHHNRAGHGSFLLGEYRWTGWWYYFPVVLAVKTPLAFLILVALGTLVCLKKRSRPVYLLPLAFSLGILLPAMRSRIDIGIRHIEPIWIGLSIIAAIGLTQLAQWCRTRLTSVLTVGALAVWMVASVASHHPDYIAYFNGLAGNHPENIVADSNNDYGQDMKLLAKRLHELGAKEVSLATLDGVGNSFPQRYEYLEAWYGLPHPKAANTCTPAQGWNVVGAVVEQSLSRWPLSRFYRGPKMSKPWYEQIAPDQRIGPLLLYNIPSGLKVASEGCN